MRGHYNKTHLYTSSDSFSKNYPNEEMQSIDFNGLSQACMGFSKILVMTSLPECFWVNFIDEDLFKYFLSGREIRYWFNGVGNGFVLYESLQLIFSVVICSTLIGCEGSAGKMQGFDWLLHLNFVTKAYLTYIIFARKIWKFLFLKDEILYKLMIMKFDEITANHCNISWLF